MDWLKTQVRYLRKGAMKKVDGNTNKAITTNNTRMIVHSAGGLAFALTYQCFSTYVRLFYIDVLQLAASWVGAAVVVYVKFRGNKR